MFCIFRRFVELYRARKLKRAERVRPVRLRVEFAVRLASDSLGIEEEDVVPAINAALAPRAPLRVDPALVNLAKTFSLYQTSRKRMKDAAFCDGITKRVSFKAYISDVFFPPLFCGARELIVDDASERIGVAFTRLRPDLFYCVVVVD